MSFARRTLAVTLMPLLALTTFFALSPQPTHAQESATHLTSFDEIAEAIRRGDPTVHIADGEYRIPHGEGLVITTDGQRIIGESDRGVTLIATGSRGDMGSRGVIEILADDVEVANLVLTQTLDQLTTYADTPDEYPVVGIWSEGNGWYLHDLHIDRTSFGLALWKGSPDDTLRRAERILVTNWGYQGSEFGHSGYGMYVQTDASGSDTVLDMEDLVFQNGTDIGVHDFATFNMPGPRRIRGVAVTNAGSPTITGQSGDATGLYLAKAADVEITNLHVVQMDDGFAANNLLGYGTEFTPERAVLDEIWMLNQPTSTEPGWGSVPMRQQVEFPVFELTNTHQFDDPDDRGDFRGLQPLGDTWGILYGPDEVPDGWEELPGSIGYPAVDTTNPAMPGVRILRLIPPEVPTPSPSADTTCRPGPGPEGLDLVTGLWPCWVRQTNRALCGPIARHVDRPRGPTSWPTAPWCLRHQRAG